MQLGGTFYEKVIAHGRFPVAKHGANGDEVFLTMPGHVSLNAYFRNNPEITALLSKYGFNK